MRIERVLIFIAFAAGLASGPSSLESASVSEPPIRWGDLAFVFGGCFISLPLLFGLQAALKRHKSMRWFWRFFFLLAIYLLAAGASSVVIAVASESIAPHAFLFLVMGCGLAFSVLAVRALFSSKWATNA